MGKRRNVAFQEGTVKFFDPKDVSQVPEFFPFKCDRCRYSGSVKNDKQPIRRSLIAAANHSRTAHDT